MVRADTWIPVRADTFDALGVFRGPDETWDDVLRDLISARRKQNLRDLLDRTDDEDYVPLEDS